MREFSALVAGVVYPGGESYFMEYARSLSGQTDQEFDLMLINDGAGEKLREIFPSKTTWIDLDEKITPAEIRQLIIDKAGQEGYEQLIFTDLDDYFSSNRVFESKQNLKNYDFVFNEIALVDQSGKVFQESYLSSLNIGNEIAGYQPLQDRNFIGLGNSAINLNAAVGISIPKDVLAIDWWIYSLLLIQGSRGKFLPEAITFYRQHDGNFIGMPQSLSVKKLEKGILVKQKHYSALAGYGRASGKSDIAEMAGRKLEQMDSLSQQIKDNTFCEYYIRKVNDNKEFFSGWWSEIVPASLIKG